MTKKLKELTLDETINICKKNICSKCPLKVGQQCARIVTNAYLKIKDKEIEL